MYEKKKKYNDALCKYVVVVFILYKENLFDGECSLMSILMRKSFKRIFKYSY